MKLFAATALPLLTACAASNTPDFLPAAYTQGLHLERDNRPEEAVVAFREAVARCTTDTPACRQCRTRLAEARASLGRNKAALETYLALRTWTQHAATAARASVRAARLLEDGLGQKQRALSLYIEVVSTFPAEVAADDALQRVLRLHPETKPDGQAGLARLLMDLFSKLRRSPVADNILFAAANLYDSRGDQQALTLYDRLWRGFPKSPLWDDGLWRAAQILERHQRWREAIERYRRLVATRRDAFLLGSYNSRHLDDAQLRIGILRFEKLDDTNAALEAFSALKRDFKSSILRDDAQWWIAQIHLRRGDDAAGCRELRKLVSNYPDGNKVRPARRLLRERCRR